MFDRIFRIMIKELIELRRDKWMRFHLLVPPILQMLIFGYAATFEVFHVSTTILDLDHSQESRDLINRFIASGRFQIAEIARDQSTITRDLDDGNATVAITIHPGFSELLRKDVTRPCKSRSMGRTPTPL